MELVLNSIELLLIGTGIIFLCLSITQYGKRTSDWRGACTLFVKRIEMSAQEYKWYRLGISTFILGVTVRIINLTLWG